MLRRLQKVLKILLIPLLLWMGGFVIFLIYIPRAVPDGMAITQAIVVLTGGRERLKAGFRLLCAGKADRIFISGVHREETLNSLFRAGEVSQVIGCHDQDFLMAHSDLGYRATNTKGNAFETAEWVVHNGIHSLHLVTAAYHMPRSLLEIKELLPHVAIIPYPVFPLALENGSLWARTRIVQLTFLEYHKFLRAFIRIYFFAKIESFVKTSLKQALN